MKTLMIRQKHKLLPYQSKHLIAKKQQTINIPNQLFARFHKQTAERSIIHSPSLSRLFQQHLHVLSFLSYHHLYLYPLSSHHIFIVGLIMPLKKINRNIYEYSLEYFVIYNIFLSKYLPICQMNSLRNTDSQVTCPYPQLSTPNLIAFSNNNLQRMSLNLLENKSFFKHNQNETHSASHIRSDLTYNDKIYAWRKIETGPIVKVYAIKHYHDFYPINGSTVLQNVIEVEKIVNRLSDLSCFSIEQAMLILKKMIEGYQIIQKKIGAVSISLTKCGINSEGDVKVWVNEQFFRNDISGEVFNSEHQIIQKILQILYNHTGDVFKHFWEYAQSALIHSRKNAKKQKPKQWTFVLIKNIIQSFCACLHLKVPLKIEKDRQQKIAKTRRKSCEEQAKSLLQSHCSNLQSSILFQPTGMRNQSPLNELNTDRHFQQQDQENSVKSFEKSKKRRVTTTTCASAHDQMVSNLFSDKTMPRNSHIRHTSSIVNLLPSQSLSVKNLKVSQQLSNKVLHSQIKSRQTALIEQVEEEPSQKSVSQINIHQPSRPVTNTLRFLEEKTEKSADKYTISKQFDVGVQGQSNSRPSSRMPSVHSSLNEVKAKSSQISTANGSSLKGYQGFGALKSFKDSVMTIGFDDKSKSKEKRKLSHNNQQRNRFTFQKNNDSQEKNQLRSQINARVANKKKILYSCTNWSNRNEETEKSTKTSPNKAPIFLQDQLKSKENQTLQAKKNKFMLNKPAFDLKVLIEHEIESYEATQNNSENRSGQDTKRKQAQNQNEKIFEQLVGVKQNLFTSTYIDTNSQHKLESEKHLKAAQQKKSNFIARMRQEETIQNNRWTKKIEGLIGQSVNHSQLKESINCGEEVAYFRGREIKLSMLGKLGREIGRSVIPQQKYEH